MGYLCRIKCQVIFCAYLYKYIDLRGKGDNMNNDIVNTVLKHLAKQPDLEDFERWKEWNGELHKMVKLLDSKQWEIVKKSSQYKKAFPHSI